MPNSRSRLIPQVDLDKDGVQHGTIRLFHSTHASAYGFIPIPITVIRNGDGPTALFTAGMHGDEYEGQIAISRLGQWLKPDMVKGRVILLPMANFPAALAGRRTSPIDEGNLNRSFPGDPDGTVTQQIAYFIEHDIIPHADFLCDLHSGGSSLMYVPSSLTSLYEDVELRRRALAGLRAFGAPLGYVAKKAQGQGGNQNSSSAAERFGVPSIGTELGGSGTATPAALRIAERGMRNLLVHLGIIGREHHEETAPTRILEVAGPDYFTYAPEPGIFEPVVELGDEVRAGQLAGRIYTPETMGRPPTEFHFAADGLVLCKRIPGRTVRGDCLFHLGSDWTER